MNTFLRRLFLAAVAAPVASFVFAAPAPPTPPQPGEAAPNFRLETLDRKTVELKQLTVRGPVVLIVLRGFPGYQCPLCTRQVKEFAVQASEFARRGAQVVMVYPGPAELLQAKAREFLQDKQWPAEFLFVLDPDYAFTNAYGLRWDAPKETAYPSTFVIGDDGKVKFSRVSKTHGGRTTAAQVLAELK